MSTLYPTEHVPSATRIWFISDTHLGVRNNSSEWIDIIDEYFDQFFFPTVQENIQPGDILVHAGDFYDSRQSVNLRVLDQGIRISERLAKTFVDGVWIIVGNHDIFGKNSNEINSLKSLKWIPGVRICEEPLTLRTGQGDVFLLPWRKDSEDLQSTLESADPHDYLVCHADIQGFKYNKYVTLDKHGTEVAKFHKFGQVFTGHIHYGQRQGNVLTLGSPYELTRSDMDNQKGIYLLDLATRKMKFFPNNVSPKFKKMPFSWILEQTVEELNQEFNNNFVDIIIDPQMAIKAPLHLLTDAVESPRRLEFHPHDPNQSLVSSFHYDPDSGNKPLTFDVMHFLHRYVDQMDLTPEDAQKIRTVLEKLHHMSTDMAVHS